MVHFAQRHHDTAIEVNENGTRVVDYVDPQVLWSQGCGKGQRTASIGSNGIGASKTRSGAES